MDMTWHSINEADNNAQNKIHCSDCYLNQNQFEVIAFKWLHTYVTRQLFLAYRDKIFVDIT